MTIPNTRAELTDLTSSTFKMHKAELDAAGPRVGSLSCVDDWSVKELLVVRAWWTENVVEWIEAGRRGETPFMPAEGYRWISINTARQYTTARTFVRRALREHHG